MLPSPVYQPPLSNIAYHVYNPEDDLDRVQAVSQRAFQRILDSYTENERLADLFQVEHDKQQKLLRERKEREKLLKQQQKKQSKRQHGNNHGYLNRSQDRVLIQTSSSVPFERQSFRRFARSTATSVFPVSSTATASTTIETITEKTGDLQHQSTGSLKRTRRLSDISNSDISGLGDDEVRSSPLPHAQISATSRPTGLGIHLTDSNNDRSISSSPALLLTPPRDSPSNSISQTGQDGSDHSSNQIHSAVPSSVAASTSSSFAAPNLPESQEQQHKLQTLGTGRRKRKQAIPVHPSIVERIPGITIKIQRERQGEHLEVEIIKNLDDYKGSPLPNEVGLAPAAKLQAKQDLRKVRESIDSGRLGYAYYPPAGGAANLVQRQQSQSSNSADYANGGLDWTKSFPGSFSWTSSSTNSTDNFSAMQELIDARSMPLSWENFATRECVVNKLVGKHDKDLNTLEEVVQDTIARQQYALQLLQEQEEQERLRAQSLTPIDSYRGLSVGFTGSDNGISGSTSITHPTSSRAARSSAVSGMRTRSIPARATRSKAQSASKAGQLLAHDDIEHHLKEKRRRQREKEHRRQSSKTSSKDGNEDEDDDEDDDDKRDSSHRTTHDGDDSALSDEAESDDEGGRMSSKGTKRKYTRRNAVRRDFKQDEVPTSTSSSDDDRKTGSNTRKRHRSSSSPHHGSVDNGRSRLSSSRGAMHKKTFKQAPHQDRKENEPIRRNKKFWNRGRNSRKVDEVEDDTTSNESDSGEDDISSSRGTTGRSIQTRLTDNWIRKDSRARKLSDSLQISWKPRRAFRRPSVSQEEEDGSGSDGGALAHGSSESKNQAFAKTLNSSENAKFFNAGVELIHQKNLEMLESRRQGNSRSKKLREEQVVATTLQIEKNNERDIEKEKAKERELQESRVKLEVRLVEESKAQKVESTNLPRSSKSLPGRVLRRAGVSGGVGGSGGEDPDCTSCRLELSAAEKDAWKLAQESGEIRLPKTWGTHAILCVACRNQYLGHHSRCTACFYVPVEEEMESSGKRCSRCKAGTWLTELAQRPSNSSAGDDRKERRHQVSELSV
ncbi:hypothetical protein FBU30_002522 [Linnemannia zychae]|nr:hypothetical protein FBU30_002522 [Linnemannia zychae]